MSIKMIATARQMVDGRCIYPGQTFEVGSESDADDLEAMVFARRAELPVAEAETPAVYRRTDLRAEEPPRRRRGRPRKARYERTDMVAEE